MSNTSPLFSVVIPAYKCADFIQLTLRSVYLQTEQDFEIIVINDGSPDNTEEVLQRETDPRLRVITQENGGECAARNRGIKEARGTFIAFLDSDDAWLPDHLALAKEFFEKNPMYDWYSTRPLRIEQIDTAKLKPSNEPFDGFWAVNWFLEGDIQTSSSSAVLRRSAINHQELFPNGVRMFGDNIGWCRFALQHSMMGTCYRTTALYRIWVGSATDTFLANTGGSKSGAGLDAFLLHAEMATKPDCPEEAHLFFRHASLYNWWVRARSVSLRPWLPEIAKRKFITGPFLNGWLTLCVHFSHFFALLMGKIVRIQFNQIEREQMRKAAKTRRKLH